MDVWDADARDADEEILDAAIAGGGASSCRQRPQLVGRVPEQWGVLHPLGPVLADRREAVVGAAAGDAFTAALALHYLQHGDLRAAVPYANVAGALACTRLGAQPSLPTAAEVERVLRQNASGSRP